MSTMKDAMAGGAAFPMKSRAVMLRVWAPSARGPVGFPVAKAVLGPLSVTVTGTAAPSKVILMLEGSTPEPPVSVITAVRGTRALLAKFPSAGEIEEITGGMISAARGFTVKV